MRKARLAQWLAAGFVAVGAAFWMWPSIAVDAVWWAMLVAALLTSVAAAFSDILPFCYGWLMTSYRRLWLLSRLALVDFGSESSATRRFVLWIPLSAIAIGIAWRLDVAIYAVVAIFALLALEVWYLLLRLTPPLVLFLGASEAHDPMRGAILLSTTLVGRRLVTIQRPDQRTPGGGYARLLSYRTHDDLWQDMLVELYGLASVIVLDLRIDTPAVSFELEGVLAGGLGYKAVALFGDQQRADHPDAYRLVEDLLTAKGGVSVSTFDGLPYIMRAFCHPAMPMPSAERTIADLVGDIRRANPDVDFAVRGPVPPPRGDTTDRHYVVR